MALKCSGRAVFWGTAWLLLLAVPVAAQSPPRAGAVPAVAEAAPTTVAVTGAVAHPLSLDLAALQALPAVTATVDGKTYTGAGLWALLAASAGLQPDAGRKNPVLSMYLLATGSDGYQALVSLAEIHPDFGNRPALVAYRVDGAPLGAARLILPADGKPGRFVARLKSLDVVNAPH